MLHDDRWAKLAEKNEWLCAECFFERADRAHCLPVTLADLMPCNFNRVHEPHSWYDLFAKSAEPSAREAWLAEASFSLGPDIPEDIYGKPEIPQKWKLAH